MLSSFFGFLGGLPLKAKEIKLELAFETFRNPIGRIGSAALNECGAAIRVHLSKTVLTFSS